MDPAGSIGLRFCYASTATHRIENAGDKFVEGLLVANESPMEKPNSGSSASAEKLAQNGPRDRQERSSRNFDLAGTDLNN
jgi:hypothetical protein